MEVRPICPVNSQVVYAVRILKLWIIFAVLQDCRSLVVQKSPLSHRPTAAALVKFIIASTVGLCVEKTNELAQLDIGL